MRQNPTAKKNNQVLERINRMNTELKFKIKFFGPFLVGGQSAGDGFDIRVDRTDAIPSTSIKGRLRAEASQILHVDEMLLNEIFGSEAQPSSWWFSGVNFGDTSDLQFKAANRVAMDAEQSDAGIPDEGQLVFYEQCWAEEASFSIEQVADLHDEQIKKHQAVLLAAAGSVNNFGAMRRRGHGWIAISPEEPYLDIDDVIQILKGVQHG